MTSNIKKSWDYGQVDLTATSTAYLITKLKGGESATIKALSGNSGSAYVGSNQAVSTTTGFQLNASDSVTLTLPIEFGVDNEVEIYAVTSNAGDDVCYIKLIDSYVETSTG